RGPADPHRPAVTLLEPDDLRDGVAGEQPRVPLDLRERGGEHHLRRLPPVPRELGLGWARAGLLVAGLPVAHRLPQPAPVEEQLDRSLLLEPELEQLVARLAPAEVAVGRGDVAVEADVHAVDQLAHGRAPFARRPGSGPVGSETPADGGSHRAHALFTSTRTPSGAAATSPAYARS